MTVPKRPALRWHGGKWMLAPWIIAHLPSHRVYVEPFGGAASVLVRKPQSYAEVYNDLDDEVVNLFRVLRDSEGAARLHGALLHTPFARTEFEAAYRPARDRVERARRLIIRSFMGYGSDGASRPYRTGFRSNSNRSGTTPAHDWRNYADALPVLSDRLRAVIVENRDAAQVMATHDGAETLHYVDPPYLPETRMRRVGAQDGCYRHELTFDDHVGLLALVRDLRGMVVVSGYPSDLYDGMLYGWRRVDRPALADGAKPRTEVLWINPAADQRLRGAA